MIKEAIPEEDLNKKLKKISEAKEREESIKDIEERTALPDEEIEEDIFKTPGVKRGKGWKTAKEHLEKKKLEEKEH
jgi:hypothetical protein